MRIPDAAIEAIMRHDLVGFTAPLAKCLGLFTGGAAVAPGIFRCGLTLAKCLGLFRIARYITRDGLRIICYHGFAVAEEYKYRSRLFIRKELFRRRIEYLQRKR